MAITQIHEDDYDRELADMKKMASIAKQKILMAHKLTEFTETISRKVTCPLCKKGELSYTLFKDGSVTAVCTTPRCIVLNDRI